MTVQQILDGAKTLLAECQTAHDEATEAKVTTLATLTVARSALKNAVDNLTRHVAETPPPVPVPAPVPMPAPGAVGGND